MTQPIETSKMAMLIKKLNIFVDKSCATNAGYIIIEHLSFDEFLISIFPFHLNL